MRMSRKARKRRLSGRVRFILTWLSRRASEPRYARLLLPFRRYGNLALAHFQHVAGGAPAALCRRAHVGDDGIYRRAGRGHCFLPLRVLRRYFAPVRRARAAFLFRPLLRDVCKPRRKALKTLRGAQFGRRIRLYNRIGNVFREKEKTRKIFRAFQNGSPMGNRTPVFAVRGRRLNRLTMRP